MNHRGWMFIGFSRQYPTGRLETRTFQNEAFAYDPTAAPLVTVQ